MNQIDLKGKVAVITGGARGIGYAVAERLPQAKATLGSTQGNEGRVETQLVDITDEDAVLKATAASIKALGKIDILVNSAGITGPNQKVWEYSSKDFRQVMDINVTGTFH